MNPEIQITLISTGGLVLVALIGVWVELRKARKGADTVVHEMQPNHGGSLRDAVNKVADQVSALDSKVDGVTERLVRVETRQEFTIPAMRSGNE